jgi:hypothetical protein
LFIDFLFVFFWWSLFRHEQNANIFLSSYRLNSLSLIIKFWSAYFVPVKSNVLITITIRFMESQSPPFQVRCMKQSVGHVDSNNLRKVILIESVFQHY